MSDQAICWLIYATLVLGAFWGAAVLFCVFSDVLGTDTSRMFSPRKSGPR